jgi:hypothetical protein
VVVEGRSGGRLGRTRRHQGERRVIRADVERPRIGVIGCNQKAPGEALLNLHLQAVVVGVVAGLKDEEAAEILRIRLEEGRGKVRVYDQRFAVGVSWVGSRLETVGQRVCGAAHVVGFEGSGLNGARIVRLEIGDSSLMRRIVGISGGDLGQHQEECQ